MHISISHFPRNRKNFNTSCMKRQRKGSKIIELYHQCTPWTLLRAAKSLYSSVFYLWKIPRIQNIWLRIMKDITVGRERRAGQGRAAQGPFQYFIKKTAVHQYPPSRDGGQVVSSVSLNHLVDITFWGLPWTQTVVLGMPCKLTLLNWWCTCQSTLRQGETHSLWEMLGPYA